MYYFFEIYTKHPVTRARGWDIVTGWVKIETKVAIDEDAKAAALAEIKKNIKNFDTVINLYRGNPQATDLDQAENLFVVNAEKEVTTEIKENVKNNADVLAKSKTKLSVKWGDAKVLRVIEEARRLGKIAAADKLAELQKAGPKWAVCTETHPFSSKADKVVGTMLDVCGFANINISARGKFFQIAKKLSKTGSHRFYCTVAYRGGGHLSIYDSSHRQEMSVNKATCVGQAKVLNAYGIETSITTRID